MFAPDAIKTFHQGLPMLWRGHGIPAAGLRIAVIGTATAGNAGRVGKLLGTGKLLGPGNTGSTLPVEWRA